jgi:hypothetical protein
MCDVLNITAHGKKAMVGFVEMAFTLEEDRMTARNRSRRRWSVVIVGGRGTIPGGKGRPACSQGRPDCEDGGLLCVTSRREEIGRIGSKELEVNHWDPG